MTLPKILKRRNKNLISEEKTTAIIEWPDHIVSLTNEDFDQFINDFPLSVVDFWASWCAPCKAMVPRLRRLSKLYHKRVAFGKVDIQEYRHIAKKNKIMGIPHLIFFRYGKKVGSITGLKSIGSIKDVIEDLLNIT